MKKGYSYLSYVEPSSEPRYVDLSFKDIMPEFSSIELGDQKLYLHQYEAYSSLKNGFNIVLKAGTGSGKTEAWVLYLFDKIKERGDFCAIAIYPTLALANDQIKRLNKYLSLINKKPVQLDSVKKEEYTKISGLTSLRLTIASSNLVITNPAFLLHDLKKFFIKKSSALFTSIYGRLDFLVIDELDFYSPRSLALLLAMVSLLSEISENKPQIAILSAGIANPEDLCLFLENITTRKCTIIEGEPFKVENYTYIVLGKNLEAAWKTIREMWNNIIDKNPELSSLTEIIDNYEEFKKNAYRIISLIESLGYEAPSLYMDPVEILSDYFNDSYVTLVFTRSINSAEELAKAIKSKHGESAPIATHHHLIPKKLREEIEEKARRGDVKIIISPRTLSQGIDIGLVTRIVHLGLPDNIREFYQREGRKGRRRELLFAETVIIPYSRWDRELLSSGFEAFKTWLNLGLEKTLVNSNNLYIYLFTGVIKLISPWFKRDLDQREIEVLKKTDIITPTGEIAEKRLREVYEKLNFYEYAPPYGIKRYLDKGGRLFPLEPIGHCNLVERFQPGCIDYGEEAIVISLEHGKSTRYVKNVLEKNIREIDLKSNDALATVLEEYRYIKLRWGETPHILKDLLGGRITSDMLCVVYTPKNGFGKYIKVPERCIWTVRSERPRYILIKGSPVVYHDKRNIYVPMSTGGEYRDFTYGYTYALDSRENADLTRLALSYIIVLIRRYFGIPLKTIMYDVTKIGEYKYFSLHEPEAAGIIEKLNWMDVRKVIEAHQPDEIDRILIEEIDDISYSNLISIEFDWKLVKEQAIRVVDYILSRDKVRAVFRGRELYIPRPSPALKKLAYVIISEVLNEESLTPTLLTAHGVFDGDKFTGTVELYPPIPLIKPPQPLLELEGMILDKVFYEEFKLLVENRDIVLTQLKQANLRRLVSLLESSKDLVIDVSQLLDKFSIERLSIDEIGSQLECHPSVSYATIRDVLRKIREHKKVLRGESELINKYMEEKARLLYTSYFILEEVFKTSSEKV